MGRLYRGEIKISEAEIAMVAYFKSLQYEPLCRSFSVDMFEHLPTLVKYGQEVEHITELGVRWGTSLAAWLMAKPKVLRGYDVKLNQLSFGLRWLYGNYASEVGIDFELIEADDLTADIESTDLLFIDTEHTYEQLRIELITHAGKVSKYIICHDTNLPVMELAINDFVAIGDWRVKEKLTNCYGLTVLERRKIENEH